MPYHRVTVHDSDTGAIEEFSVRISAEGVRDWLLHREALRAEGKPDRPPDVDTETLRIWLPHPGEERLPFFVAQQHKPAGQPFFAVYMASWPSVAFVLYAYHDASGYLAVVQSENPAFPSMDRTFDASLSDEAVWAEVEELLVHLNVATRPPLVTTYMDLLLSDVETKAAEADIARGFLNPLVQQYPA